MKNETHNSNDIILKLSDLRIAFGSNQVLQGIDMQLRQQTITALMGANGAGKTTLFNIISGFMKADSGKVMLKMKLINSISPAKRTTMGVTRTFQDLRLIKELTVKENIVLAFKDNPGEKLLNAILPKNFNNSYNEKTDDLAEAIIEKVFLSDIKNSLAGEISYGQQKLLNLGCCIANDPQLMLLDEPAAGVNIEYQKKIKNVLKELKNSGKTILMIDHNADFISSVSDNILFLNEGSITNYENYNEFQNSDYVKSAYH